MFGSFVFLQVPGVMELHAHAKDTRRHGISVSYFTEVVSG